MMRKREPAPAEDSGADTPATEALVPEPPTPEQIEDLKNRAAKADENWDRLLRAMADLDNFKKRAAREREEAQSTMEWASLAPGW